MVCTHQIFSQDEIRELKKTALSLKLLFTTRNENIHNISAMQLGPPWIDHFTNKVMARAEEIYRLKLQRHSDFFLKYDIGAKADVHQDAHSLRGGISTVTLLHKTDDLQGGHVIAEGVEHPQEVGDTIFYGAHTWHGVTEVTQGTRLVLIGWYANQ